LLAGLRLRAEVLTRTELRAARRRSSVGARVELRLAEISRWRTVGDGIECRAVVSLLRERWPTGREQDDRDGGAGAHQRQPCSRIK
jgi:hypothetical protein